jgi:hypothetical protein
MGSGARPRSAGTWSGDGDDAVTPSTVLHLQTGLFMPRTRTQRNVSFGCADSDEYVCH